MNKLSSENIEPYLEKHNYAKNISMFEIWAEMDRVWDEYNLDNRKKLDNQSLISFYKHPVWVLNGLFSNVDKASISHRMAIASFIIKQSVENESIHIADFGGGSGVLADQIIKQTKGTINVDIIEPSAFDYFIKKYVDNKNIRFTSNFNNTDYDIVIAQTVLEHVDNPIDVAIKCIQATRKNGLIIFGNDFNPVIKCHLPTTFYLRHTFRYIITGKSIKYLGTIPGCPYAQVYIKTNEINNKTIKTYESIAKIVGPILNLLVSEKNKLCNFFSKKVINCGQ